MSTLGDLTAPKIDQTGPPLVGEFTYVDISSVDNSLKRIIEPKRLPVAVAPSRARQCLRAGDVLVSMTRPNLNAVAIVPPELDGAVGSTGFHVLRALDGIEPRWLFYSVQTRDFVETMSSMVQGALYPAVRPKEIRAFGIEAPPLDEQRRTVAEIEKQFSRLDDAVTNLMRVKSNLKRYRTSVLKFLYSGGSMTEELPSGWKWTTIGEQFRVEVGATPSRKHSGYWGGAIPWVSSGEVQFRRVKRTTETITREGLRNSSTKLNPAGSVLLGMIGQGRTRGQAAILDIEAANNQNCAAIWVSETKTPPEFVYYWFMSQYEATRRVGSGNNQQALNKSLVQHLPMPWPGSIAEQRRLVAQVEERLQVVEELEAQVRANLVRSQYLRRTSLQRAFVQRAEAGL